MDSGFPRGRILYANPSIFRYSEGLDSAPPHSPDRPFRSPSPEGVETLGGIQTPELQLKDLSGLEIHELWREDQAHSFGFRGGERATGPFPLGAKKNNAVPP